MKQVKGNNWLSPIMLKGMPGGTFFWRVGDQRTPICIWDPFPEKILGVTFQG